MKNNRVRKLIAVTAVATMCMTTAIPAMAAGTSGGVTTVPDGTDVMAGVTVEDETNADARIRVTVPTMFAFVANGSKVVADQNKTLTATDGSILLPNVQVKVLDATSATSNYEVSTVGDSAMTFTNYSTKADQNTNSKRAGIPVKLTGAIENKGTAASRNYWTHVANATTGFKQYTVSVDGKKFDQAAGTDKLAMNAAAVLAAPAAGETVEIDATTKLANAGASKDLAFDVAIGGTRGDYQQVEQSAKVGSIEWTVAYETNNTTTQFPTSPSNPPASAAATHIK